MIARLEVTDGTTTISLIQDGGNAFNLNRWQPTIIPVKGGGTWQQSALSDGRQLVNKHFGNAIEPFDLKIAGEDANIVIGEVEALRLLLEKAADFWTTDWQDTIVYLIAQAECEDNPRYAIIYDWSTPEDENPFAQPFLQVDGSAVMDNFTLSIERGHWRSNIPDTGASVSASAVEAYDGRNLGNVSSGGSRQAVTTRDVFIANKQNVANLTDIYIDDGGAFSANLMDAGLPYGLLPAVPATGDHVYFGIDTTVSDSGPFCSLVFDVGTVAVYGGGSVIWRYWDGGAWAVLTVQDTTSAGSGPFAIAGVNPVYWVQPSDWATVAVNGVTGYWVRATVSIIGGPVSQPTQQNRDVYSVVWSYSEIDEAQVEGSLPAVAQIKFQNVSDGGGPGVNPDLYADRVIVGLRSLLRGSAFISYFNASDEQNPTGIGANCAFATDVTTPSGRRVTYNPVAIDTMASRVSFVISETIAQDFYGTYHAYVRGRQVGGAARDIKVRLRVRLGAGNVTDITEEVPFPDTNDWRLLDMGEISIPTLGVLRSADVSNIVYLIIDARNDGAGLPDAYFYDLVLIPVDEWAGDFINPDLGGLTTVLRTGIFLDMDAIVNPKRRTRALQRNLTGQVNAVYRTTQNGFVMLQVDQDQRYWFLTARAPASAIWISEPWVGHRMQLFKNEQHFSMRGSG